MKPNFFDDFRQLLIPIIATLVVMILTFVGAPYVFNRIVELNEELSDAKAQESLLRSKLQVLSAFSPTGQTTSDGLAKAFPGENSTLGAISQIKQKAVLGQVLVSGVKAGKGVIDESTAHADIDFDVEGDISQTLTFLESLKTTSPFGSVRSVKVTGFSGTAGKSVVTYRVYWAPFPESIPPILSPITDFSPDERSVIAELTALEVLPGSFEATPQTPQSRSDPFGI